MSRVRIPPLPPFAKQMFTVYVLRSLKNGRHYSGFSSRDMGTRLREHNNGAAGGWTSRNGPFEVIYTEEHATEVEARARERSLKSGHGREWLKYVVKAEEESTK